MTSVSCLKCGLVSWAAEGGVCRRCGTPAASAPPLTRTSAPAFYADYAEEAAPELAPPRTFGILLTILGLLLAFGGTIILVGSRPTPFFLVEGIGIAVSGALIASGKRAGMYLYFATLALVVVWSAVETAGETGKLLPRIFLPMLIGLGIAREQVRSRLR